MNEWKIWNERIDINSIILLELTCVIIKLDCLTVSINKLIKYQVHCQNLYAYIINFVFFFFQILNRYTNTFKLYC